MNKRRSGVKKAAFGNERGSQLMEMALALPFLLVFVVGLSDFGGAYNVKQKITSAAREGARLAVSSTTADLSTATPDSIVAIKNTVSNNLTNAGLTACTFGTATKSGLSWTFSPNANCVLKIERNNSSVTSGGATLISSQVTITYPVTWSFNRVMGLLVRNASPVLPASLTSVALMENIP